MKKRAAFMEFLLTVVTCITAPAHKKLHAKTKNKIYIYIYVALLSMTKHMVSWPRKLPMKAALCLSCVWFGLRGNYMTA